MPTSRTPRPRTPAPADRTGGGDAAPEPALRTVSSAGNASFKVWRSLLAARGLRKHGQALLAGATVAAEVAADFGGHVEACLLGESGPGAPPQLPRPVPQYRLTPDLLRELDPGGAGPPILVVRIPDMPAWEVHEWDAADGCTLFVPFQDPINVGATLRSAAAFGVHRVVLLREAAHPFHPRSVQAGGSALFRVPLFRGPALRDLDTKALPCFTLDLAGAPLRGFRFPERFALVPGLEGSGMPNLAGESKPVYIPISPGVDSLNAAAATAIALYHWRVHVSDLW